MKKKTICFDIDNVISQKSKKYKNAKPILSSIKIINELYDKGFTIKILTARYMGTYNDNIKLIKKLKYKETYNQLKKWNVKFHKLFMTKPSFDLLIDDKAFNYNKSWKKFIKTRYLK